MQPAATIEMKQMTNEPKQDRRAIANRANGMLGGRPLKPPTDTSDCTCGAPNGRHRQPCPVYHREYRRGLRGKPGRPPKSPDA